MNKPNPIRCGGPTQRKEKQFDELNHRFSDLLVGSFRPRPISEDNSDSLFEGIEICKNDTFTGSRSNLDDDLQLFPTKPGRTINKHVLLTSDELGLPVPMVGTPVNTSKKQPSKTSTPFSNVMTPYSVFKTPVSSSKTTTPQLSVQKRYAIDKAVASAKREFGEMIKSINLKKRTLNSSKKEIKSTILDSTCKSSVSSTACNSLFGTPTATASNKTDEGTERTPLTTKSPLPGTSYWSCRRLLNESHIKQPIVNSISNDNKTLPTQSMSSTLLRDVVAFVEVRCGRDYLSEGTKAELESLGAKVEKNFTRKVTHCFFRGGKMSTYRKAIEWKVPLVSTLWIEGCKEEMTMLPTKGYEPNLDKYREALPLYKLKTKWPRRAATDSKIQRKPWKENNLKEGTQGVTTEPSTPVATFKEEPRQAVTDSKIQRKPWKENKLKEGTQGVTTEPLPPVATFKETDKIVDALHSVAGDLRKATKQFEKIPTSPVSQKKLEEARNSNGRSSNNSQTANTSNCGRKCNKKLVFGSSSDDENKDDNSETGDTSYKINDINDSEVRVSYDSDDLLIYAKKRAANVKSSAPPRLLNSRKCKKLVTPCKEPEIKNNGEIKSSNVVIRYEENSARSGADSRGSRKSKNQLKDDEKEKTSVNLTQTKKRKLSLLSQVMENFNQDSSESTPPASLRNPYKKPKTGLAAKSKAVGTCDEWL